MSAKVIPKPTFTVFFRFSTSTHIFSVTKMVYTMNANNLNQFPFASNVIKFFLKTPYIDSINYINQKSNTIGRFLLNIN